MTNQWNFVTQMECERKRLLVEEKTHKTYNKLTPRLAIIDDKIQKNHERHLIFRKDIDSIVKELKILTDDRKKVMWFFIGAWVTIIFALWTLVITIFLYFNVTSNG